MLHTFASICFQPLNTALWVFGYDLHITAGEGQVFKTWVLINSPISKRFFYVVVQKKKAGMLISRTILGSAPGGEVGKLQSLSEENNSMPPCRPCYPLLTGYPTSPPSESCIPPRPGPQPSPAPSIHPTPPLPSREPELDVMGMATWGLPPNLPKK